MPKVPKATRHFGGDQMAIRRRALSVTTDVMYLIFGVFPELVTLRLNTPAGLHHDVYGGAGVFLKLRSFRTNRRLCANHAKGRQCANSNSKFSLLFLITSKPGASTVTHISMCKPCKRRTMCERQFKKTLVHRDRGSKRLLTKRLGIK